MRFFPSSIFGFCGLTNYVNRRLGNPGELFRDAVEFTTTIAATVAGTTLGYLTMLARMDDPRQEQEDTLGKFMVLSGLFFLGTMYCRYHCYTQENELENDLENLGLPRDSSRSQIKQAIIDDLAQLRLGVDISVEDFHWCMTEMNDGEPLSEETLRIVEQLRQREGRVVNQPEVSSNSGPAYRRRL